MPLSLARFPALSATCLLISAAGSLQAADLDHGRMLFQQSCALCHATGLEQKPASGQGPLLAGIMGRRAASLSTFGYSKALQASGVTWDAANLDKFLTAPGTFVPGTTMVIAVANSDDRRDLIEFLATLRPMGSSAAPQPGSGHHPRTAGDWQNDAPGAIHRIDAAALPEPFATSSAGNSPRTSDRPQGAMLSVPAGFTIQLFATGLSGPRLVRTAPNGDLFIAETRRGQIHILRAADGASAPTESTVFADHLKGPFGIAFYPLGDDPQWVYVANLNSLVRFPYRSGDLKARGPAEILIPKLADTTGGHSTRDVVFSLDGKRMFVSVGSGSNVADGISVKTAAEIGDWESGRSLGAAWGYEANRANILVTDPDVKQPVRVYAAGIRNPVGLAVQPETGNVWASTNERDGLGDDLVPDYITHVQEGGYYGWPWYYMGNHEDPRRKGERPDLAGKAIVPDVPVQSHSASLQMTFYPKNATGVAAFPADYAGDAFAAFHGSWNRTGRTGSKVVRVHIKNGVATGDYEDFLTGFVIDDGHVWGRPVGVTVAHDGALIVTEDANDTVWRIAYTNKAP